MIQMMTILTTVITKVIPTNIIILCSNLNYLIDPFQAKQIPGTATPEFEIPVSEGTHTTTRNYTDKNIFMDDLGNYGDVRQ